MGFLKPTDGMDLITKSLRGLRANMADLMTGADLCDQQFAANVMTIEQLSNKNSALSARAAGVRSLIREVQVLVPVE